MNNKAQLARKELARRELTRRQSSMPEGVSITSDNKNLSKEEEQGGDVSLYQAAIPSGIRKEVIAPLAKGASNYAFGVPKVLMGKMAGPDASKQIFADQETMGGKALNIASEGAGYIGGGAAKLGLKVGEKLLPKAASKIIMSDKGIPKVIGDTMLRKAGRGAIAGGVAGGTQLSPDNEGNVSAGQQGMQAGVGAGLGAVLEPAIAFVSKAGKAYKRWQRGAKTPAVDVAKGKIDVDKQAISLNTAERNAAQRASDESFATKLDESKRVLQNNFDNLSQEFQESAESGAVPFQDAIKYVSREMGESYGAQLGDIADEIASSAPITRNELSSFLSSTKANLDDNLITSGHVADTIKKFESKYTPVMVGKQSRFINLATGEKAGTLRSNADEAVDFKNFIKDVKDIKKGIKYGGKTEDNVALGIFYDDLTNFLGQRPGLEKYLQLNETYAPYIQSLKTLTKGAKAYAGESETAASTNLLKRFGLRKSGVTPGRSQGLGSASEISEVNNIERLQNPSTFSKGMGSDITDPVVRKAQELAQAKQATEDIGTIISLQKKAAGKNIDNRFADNLDEIMGTKKYMESDYTMKEAMIKDAIASKLKRIGYQKDKIDIILKDRTKLKQLAGVIVGGAAGTASLYYGSKAVGNALSGK